MDDLLKIDFSGTDSYYTCPLKYHLKQKGWESQYGNTALRMGGVFHAGMEGYYTNIKENGWSRDGKAVQQMLEYAGKEWAERTGDKQFYEDHRTLPFVVDLMTRYIDYFYGDHGFLEVVHTERAYKLLIKPTKADLQRYPWLKPFWFTGKIDMECKLNGMHWTNEFKTTGWRLDQLIDELNRSPQIMGYAYAKNHVYNEPPEGCLVTVAFGTARKVKSGGYGKPSIDFRRVPQIYNEVDLKHWREHFISLAAQIQYSRNTNYFPPRLQSCYNYGRCGYLNLCEQSCDIEDANFRGYIQEEPWEVTAEVAPEELITAEEK